MNKPLRLGAAYHGNRMPHHARQDLLDMATHGMDLVVHMFSHTDWDRHKLVMKDIVTMSEDMGLEVWALIFGGILTNICIWSGHTSPSIISTPFH